MRAEALRSALRGRGAVIDKWGLRLPSGDGGDKTSWARSLADGAPSAGEVSIACAGTAPVFLSGPGTAAFLDGKFSCAVPAAGRCATGCLLTPRGRVRDTLTVVRTAGDGAAVVPHAWRAGAGGLRGLLDSWIFPADGVAAAVGAGAGGIFCVLCEADEEDAGPLGDADGPYRRARDIVRRALGPVTEFADEGWHDEEFPKSEGTFCELRYGGETVQVLRGAPGLPPGPAAPRGYTLLVDGPSTADDVYERLVSAGDDPPLAMSAFEWEAIRVRAGAAGTGEVAAAEGEGPSATHLELLLGAAVDPDKGCYLGQEGVAATSRSSRGPPRRLCWVSFPCDDDADDAVPRIGAGTELFLDAPGGGAAVAAGTVTSVTEPGAVQRGVRLCLALVRRRTLLAALGNDQTGGGGDDALLDGLEVYADVAGDRVPGKIALIPERTAGEEDTAPYDAPDGSGVEGFDVLQNEGGVRVIAPKGMPEAAAQATPAVIDAVVLDGEGDPEEELRRAEEELAAAEETARAAAAEAERKAAKMEALRARAEAAMAARKKKVMTPKKEAEPTAEEAQAAAAVEAERKAAKMEMLAARAAAAMAARKKKKKKKPT